MRARQIKQECLSFTIRTSRSATCTTSSEYAVFMTVSVLICHLAGIEPAKKCIENQAALAFDVNCAQEMVYIDHRGMYVCCVPNREQDCVDLDTPLTLYERPASRLGSFELVIHPCMLTVKR